MLQHKGFGMLKKLLTTTIIFAVTFSSASTSAAQFYLAPTLSYEDVRATNNSHFQGIVPALAFGYGGLFYPWLYLGVEIFGIWHAIDLNNEPKDGLSVKTNTSYGGSIFLGYPLDDFLVYLRLGLISTDFEKLDTTKTGKEIGLGVEIPIECNWSIRAEWDFIRYDKIGELGQPEITFFSLGATYRFG